MSRSSLFRRFRDIAAELATQDYSRKSSSELEAIRRDTSRPHSLRSIAGRVLESRTGTGQRAGSAASGSGSKENTEDSQGTAEGTAAPQQSPARKAWFASLVFYVRRHWRGEFPLLESFFGNFFLLSWILGVILAAAYSQLGKLAETWPLLAVTGIVILQLAFLPVLTWQLVGVWRSAAHHLVRTRKRFWARASQLIVMLTTANAALTYALVGAPLVAHLAKEGLGLLPYQQYQVSVSPEHTELLVSGGIGPGLSHAVESELDRNPGVKVIHLNSVGGMTQEAQKLHELISRRRLTTYVGTRCYSACTDVFLAGRERVLHEHAVLGFHALSMPFELGSFARWQLAEEIDEVKRTTQKDTRRIYVQAGVDPGFIRRVLALTNERLWAPSHEELLRANFVTQISDGAEYVMPDGFATQKGL